MRNLFWNFLQSSDNCCWFGYICSETSEKNLQRDVFSYSYCRGQLHWFFVTESKNTMIFSFFIKFSPWAFVIILFFIKRWSTLLYQLDTGSRCTSWSEVLHLRRRALTHWDCQLESRSHYMAFVPNKTAAGVLLHLKVGHSVTFTIGSGRRPQPVVPCLNQDEWLFRIFHISLPNWIRLFKHSDV